jgi:hypothetical protein
LVFLSGCFGCFFLFLFGGGFFSVAFLGGRRFFGCAGARCVGTTTCALVVRRSHP